MENSDRSAIDREAAAQRRARDLDDLQNEMAGAETGRAVRFLPGEARGPEASEKRRAEQRAEMLTRLQLLMQNPEYAALYNGTGEALRDAQNELDRLRKDAQRLADKTKDAIARIDANAARDSAGRHVFRGENGEARYADRSLVPEAEAAGIIWRGDEPTLAEREAEVERLARMEGILADIDAGQAEIGDMEDRRLDEENPPSAEELRAMQERSKEIGVGIGERLEGLSQETPRAMVTPSSSLAGVSVPTLS